MLCVERAVSSQTATQVGHIESAAKVQNKYSGAHPNKGFDCVFILQSAIIKKRPNKYYAEEIMNETASLQWLYLS